jgi:hypothetical protein
LAERLMLRNVGLSSQAADMLTISRTLLGSVASGSLHAS